MSHANLPLSSWIPKLLLTGLILATLAAFALPALAQEGESLHVGYTEIRGKVNDWTSHHVLFSNPGTEDEAIKSDRYEEWLKIVNDPRYIMHQMVRHAPAQGPLAEDVANVQAIMRANAVGRLPIERSGHFTPVSPASIFGRKTQFKIDWSDAQVSGGATQPNTFPAKFTFFTTNTPSCLNDYIAYPTGVAGSTSAASIIGYDYMYTATTGTVNTTTGPCVVAGTPEPHTYWAYNTGGTATTSPILSLDGTQAAFIQTTASVGATGTYSNSTTTFTTTTALSADIVGSVVTSTSSGIQTGTTVLTYNPTTETGTLSLQPTAAHSGAALTFTGVAQLVIFNWNGTGASATPTGALATSSPEVTLTASSLTQADVGLQISGTNIPAGDTISAVLSGTTANLTVAPTAAHANETLTITTETATTPGVAPSVTNANYNACTAPCMTTLNLSGNPTDTYSSPFYDYTDDVLYVGDNLSQLHKFTGVFLGNPTEVTPAALGTAYDLTSPVYDSLSGCVFVGDSDGNLYSVASGRPGSVCTGSSFALNATAGNLANGGTNFNGIFDAPLLDQTQGVLYVFVADGKALTRPVTATFTNAQKSFTVSASTPLSSADVGRTITGTGVGTGSTNTIATVTSTTAGTFTNNTSAGESAESVNIAMSTAGDAQIVQFLTSFGAAATPSGAQNLGAGGTNYNIYSGTFDNVYYNSTGSGNIYAVGNVEASAAELYRIPITPSGAVGTNVMEAPVVEAQVNGSHPGWSTPVTEFCNGACAVSGGATTTGTDTIYFLTYHVDNGGFPGTIGNCTGSSGNGCLLAYDVNTPGSQTLSGSVNYPFPGASANNGCWGAGGVVVDNDSTDTGSSQVYFSYFGGNTPSTVPSTCTVGAVTSNTPDAIQLDQGSLL